MAALGSAGASRSQVALGQSAAEQILARQPKRLNDRDKETAAKKIESSCRRFDKSGKGKLSVDDFYNVIKLQNRVETSKEEIRKLAEDLDKDRDGRIYIKVGVQRCDQRL